MHRRMGSNLIVALASLGLAGLTAAGAAQQAPGDAGYQGVSRPPSDSIQATPDAPPLVLPKPSAGVVATPAPAQPAPQATYASPAAQDDYQPVQPADAQSQPPNVASYNAAADPDSDIVRPLAAHPGELLGGATIRVKLLDRLSSSQSEKGEPFRGQVASDVMQDGKVLIPAGSAIEGRVTAATSGHFGGHGSFRLRPEAVVLPDGSRYQLHAETTGTPGSNTRIGGEGTINAGSRAKKNAIEYGAVVGTGAVVGAVVGGPVGALTGSLVGAGIVTTHLMVDHPQATLEPGSVLLFTLTEPMNLMPASN